MQPIDHYIHVLDSSNNIIVCRSSEYNISESNSFYHSEIKEGKIVIRKVYRAN
jgi:hypothetical protein